LSAKLLHQFLDIKVFYWATDTGYMEDVVIKNSKIPKPDYRFAVTSQKKNILRLIGKPSGSEQLAPSPDFRSRLLSNHLISSLRRRVGRLSAVTGHLGALSIDRNEDQLTEIAVMTRTELQEINHQLDRTHLAVNYATLQRMGQPLRLGLHKTLSILAERFDSCKLPSLDSLNESAFLVFAPDHSLLFLFESALSAHIHSQQEFESVSISVQADFHSKSMVLTMRISNCESMTALHADAESQIYAEALAELMEVRLEMTDVRDAQSRLLRFTFPIFEIEE